MTHRSIFRTKNVSRNKYVTKDIVYKRTNVFVFVERENNDFLQASVDIFDQRKYTKWKDTIRTAYAECSTS